MKRVLVPLVTLIVFPSYGNAGLLSYECTVQQYARLDIAVSEPRELSPYGPLVVGDPKGGKDSDQARHTANFFAEVYVGQRFQVERRTGTIVGEAFAFNEYAERRVLDEGSAKQTFKLFMVSHPPISWQTLTIAEYSLGPAKPFLMVHDTELLAGTCE